MFDRSICRRNPMFLMSWTRTRSSAERSGCGDSGDLSLMAGPSGTMEVVEVDFHGNTGAQRGLRGIAADVDHHLEGPAPRVHAGADELDHPGRPGPGKIVRNDLDLVPLVDLEEILFLHVDPGQERFG